MFVGVSLILTGCVLLGVFVFGLTVHQLLEAYTAEPAQIRHTLATGRTRTDREVRVDALLRDVLSESEYCSLMTRGYLDVASPGVADRFYRISRYGGLVSVFERGRSAFELCVQPEEPLPTGDVVVLHKLLIQGSEREYLACARLYPPLGRWRLYPLAPGSPGVLRSRAAEAPQRSTFHTQRQLVEGNPE